ncbi:MAG: hypothetical protein ACFFCM_05280 [Promethearchaeota archaeon]
MGLIGKIKREITRKATSAVTGAIKKKITEKRTKTEEEKIEEEVKDKMVYDLDWDAMKEDMEELVNLNLNQDEKTIKLTFKKDLESLKLEKKDFMNISSPEEMMKSQERLVRLNMIYQMCKDKKTLKNSIGAYSQGSIPTKFDVDFDKIENSYLLYKFKNEEDIEKVHDFLNNIFFGDFFKNFVGRMR